MVQHCRDLFQKFDTEDGVNLKDNPFFYKTCLENLIQDLKHWLALIKFNQIDIR